MRDGYNDFEDQPEYAYVKNNSQVMTNKGQELVVHRQSRD